MQRIDTDVCVVGAGSAGLSMAYGASQMGARTVLIESGKMGGDCLNYGCVPSKSLLAAAKAAHAQASSAPFGIAPVAPRIDFAGTKDHVREVIDTIAPVDSQERFEGLGVNVIRARARFVSSREIEAGQWRIRARRFVIATGSRPFVPPIEGVKDVPFLTNESVFDLRDRPEHLIIIGGGPIGMEMAQAHLRLGSKVTVVAGKRALSRDDPELAAIVVARLRAEGVKIDEGRHVTRLSGAEGAVIAELDDGRTLRGTHLLMAAGRAANTDGLGLDAAGIDSDRNGIRVGDDLRTTNRRAYAIGDVAGRLQFTHLAGYHAGVIIRPILFGLPARARQDHIPWVTYTDPELAQCGLTEAQAREKHGDRLSVARFDYSENDRAQAERRTTGLIKVMVVKGRPVGASIVGAQAGELVGLWSLAIVNNLKMSAIASMVAPYPTISELNKRVVGAYFSPRLFENDKIKRVVRMVQRLLP